MTDQLPTRAIDTANTVRHVLTGHIPTVEAIRDLILPELERVRQETLKEAAQEAKATVTDQEARGVMSDDPAIWLADDIAKETANSLRDRIVQNILGLMGKE